jgi:aconitate hydratase
VLPLTFADFSDYENQQPGDLLRLSNLRQALQAGPELLVENSTRHRTFRMRHDLSARQVRFLLRGGLINWMKEQLSGAAAVPN